ncbi:MAG TPA: hypothetical protein VII33_15665 [Nakamurella sp.]
MPYEPMNAGIESIICDVPGSTAHRYGTTDSAGNTMDTVKIIDSPAGGYLGVSHTGDTVHLAASDDLLTWTFVRTLDAEATQPTIAALPTGGFVTAVEHNDQRGSGGRLRLRHYRDLAALRSGTFDRERTQPRILSRCNEGTPNVRSISLRPDIDHSIIELGFHYQLRCDLDRQAGGVLADFARWTATADTGLDDRITAAAAAHGRAVRGNIGGRDVIVVDGNACTLYEVQYRKNSFGSWRVYLHDGRTGAIDLLPIRTHRGTTAFANPTVSSITSPAGRPAVVITLFLPFEGAAPGEAGQLIYYRERS